MLLAAGGFVFWVIASKLVPVADIGHATTTLSSIAVIASFSTLGLEYTLLRRTQTERGKIVGTLFIFEIVVNALLMPVVFFFANPFVDQSGVLFSVLAVSIFMANSLAFIPKSAMLGIMNAGSVALYDGIAFAARLIVLTILAVQGLGAVAILLALLAHALVLSIVFGIATIRKVGFERGDLGYLISVIKEGINNFPAKLSRLIVMNLGIVLFAYVTVDARSVGIFYIALAISMVGGEFATSLSTMSIPASIKKGTEVVLHSTRLSLVLSTPIIAALITGPSFILGLIGNDYREGELLLFVLALGIIPTALVLGALAKFNAEQTVRKAAIMGIIEVAVFLGLFFPLVALYSVTGAALAIMISYTASASYAAKAFGKTIVTVALISACAVAAGFLASMATKIVLDHPILNIAVAAIVSAIITIVLRATSLDEIKSIAMRLKSNK